MHHCWRELQGRRHFGGKPLQLAEWATISYEMNGTTSSLVEKIPNGMLSIVKCSIMNTRCQSWRPRYTHYVEPMRLRLGRGVSQISVHLGSPPTPR